MPKTLYYELWEGHVVHQEPDGTTLLYVDPHLLHEVSSPQAFEGCDRRDGLSVAPVPTSRWRTTTFLRAGARASPILPAGRSTAPSTPLGAGSVSNRARSRARRGASTPALPAYAQG